MKTCTKCLIEKPLSEYYQHKSKGGKHTTNISICCRGKTKTSGGYKWAYA